MDKLEYLDIINDIIKDENYQRLKEEIHHNNTNRYDHNLDVSYNTFKICKKMHLDYKSATKAALLHDFYFNDDFKNQLQKILKHPKISIENASNITNLSKKEENIIHSHMYPVGGKTPRYIESIIVDIIDDGVSIKERLGGDYRSLKTAVNFLFIIFTSYLMR